MLYTCAVIFWDVELPKLVNFAVKVTVCKILVLIMGCSFRKYRIQQNSRGGKLSRLEQKWTFDGKTSAVEASCNNECLV